VSYRIGLLTALEELNLSGNCIQTLPPEISYCKFLGTFLLLLGCIICNYVGNIDLNSNELVSLPDTFGEIGYSLFELDLGNNKLESLPDNFGIKFVGNECFVYILFYF
jgi:Leucine-rich repeat (LRR) protein